MITTTYHSPLGDITLAADARGLTGLWFADQAHYGSTLEGDEPSFDMERGVFEDAVNAAVHAEPHAEAAPAVTCEKIEGCDAVSGCSPLNAEDPRNTAAVGVLERAWAWLNAYFAGQAPRWTPPLHIEGTEFQHAIWVALLEIPYGETVTYGELAHRVARRRGFTEAGLEGDAAKTPSPRAAGAAVGRNPISIIVPCHRVVGADGSLTGYAGGVERKRALLELEAAR